MVRVYQVKQRRKRSFIGGLSVTTNIIIINVVVFILLRILFPDQIINTSQGLARNFHPFVAENIAISLENIFELRIWTFLTSMFMHGGIAHLFVNMLSLFFIGSLVEKILGAKRYVWFYLISGLFAGLLFILAELFFPSGYPAVGASGALFGLVGLLVLLTPNLPVYIMFIPIPVKMKYAGPGILIVLWLISITANIGIGNTAHLGGLLAGVFYGVYLKNKYPNKLKQISRHFS